ncbi:MAG: biotin carboxylase N-terminal domain-containing protein [Gordonia sp. (in: high G+C Gram-positive bacteria)]
MAITKILVANRGEIASRVIRTCRAMGIASVAVYSDDDAFSPYVLAADEAVHLHGSRSTQTYLRGELIIEAARRTGADAIHPGYGFLSENAEFAEECRHAGLLFIGPPAEAIRVMGDKLRSKQLMDAIGVPVLRSVRLDTDIVTDLTARDVADLGYPVLVKASAGGGGRGMRIVASPSQLQEAVDSARREAASAFADGTVFVEKYVVDPRHIEVQVMADDHGNVVALYERECSIQRRHQKVIEEAPSPAVGPALRRQLCAEAVRAARAVGYRGAGTVEFVLAPDGTFAFLEMNTRLQVEHPVTELITRLDLVRLQIDVASGRRLPEEALTPRLHGHAVEARLYAEDVAAGYLPTTGTLTRLDWPAGEGVRVDAGVVSGTRISPYYDPMLAKVIAWAPTRDEALTRLATALRGTRIAGVTTNRDLLVHILEDDDVRRGAFTTSFLDSLDHASLPPLIAAADTHAFLVAAALVIEYQEHSTVTVQPAIPRGWRNNRSSGAIQDLTFGGRCVRVEHIWERDGELRVRDGELRVRVDGADECGGHLWSCSDDTVDLEFGGIRRRYGVDLGTGSVTVSSSRGALTFGVVDRFPDESRTAITGELTAAMPGNVLAVHAALGDQVEEGVPFIVLEAMKMEHTVNAPETGRVAELLVGVGDQVQGGALLARIEPVHSHSQS